MKKFFKGFFKMLLRHKILTVICFLAFTIVLVMFYIFCSVFIGGTDKYGNRLNGIEKVEFSSKELTSIADSIKENDEVDNSNVRVQGKIVYINIVYKKDVSVNKAKEIANDSLKKFDEDELKFYDIEYIMTQVNDGDKAGFKITGTKGPKTEGISYIKS